MEGNNNEPVCYLKTKLDKRNTHITKIDCAEAENFHWSQVKRFETRSDVSIAELLKSNYDIDSVKTPGTASQGTSPKGTENLDDTKETSSMRSQAKSMTVTEKHQDKTRETASISPYATAMTGTGKQDDAGETTSITPHEVSISWTEQSQKDTRRTSSIKAHSVWMPGTNKGQDDSGETTSIIPHDISMLETEKGQDDTRGTSSTGSHTTREPRTNGDYPGETKSIEPYITSMAATEKNQGNTGATPLMETHATSMMGTRHYYAFTFLPLIKSECSIETVEIYIASLSSVTVNGTIFFPFQDITNISFALAYGKGDAWELPLTVVPPESDINCTVNTTIVVETDEMVTVVGHQECKGDPFRSTAFRVRHIASLGTEYLLLTSRVNGITQAGIVALNDGTSVWINGLPQNLDRYDAYFLGGRFDVTGTNVTSNQPVAILVGNRGDKVSSIGKDAFFEYLDPCSSWGQRFLVPPFPLGKTLSYNYTVRIVARYDGTNVTLSTNHSSHAHPNVMQGNVITRLVDSRNVLEVTSSKPVLVAKFLTGVDYKCSMVLIPPINSSTVKGVVIQVLKSTESSFINVWLPNGNKPTALFLNGLTDITWKLVGNDTEGNSIVQMPLTELLKDNDDIRAPTTSCKTGPCQDKDSERTLSTEAENTSTKGTPKRDRDTKETSSIRSHSTSMTGTEKLKNRPDDAGETPSITTDAISMPATQMSEDIRRGTRSIRTHTTWMPRTNKRQDDTGEATSITPQDVSMLATQKSQEGRSGTSSTGIHTTRVPGTNRRQDDPGKITLIVPHVTSMEGTEENQGNTGGTPLMKAHTTSMMGKNCLSCKDVTRCYD
ncbi:hypothetical protein HOLleu_29013 [Holothuria leucospilota]|uniref:IgGFc-binding protein N-terminal domain-containing protein n=1 Tax=Holothuria leucospilota TaxID=206669 RepID=A0A9Q1H1X1_HOLLE|nr:hypothetical protein HOLleu_29013 [Holothuria leucospilota]